MTLSFADWILARLQKFAAEEKVAQIFADDGTSWTYDQLLQHSVHVAVGLQSVGVKRGDIVSLVARNCHELFAVVFGCIFADVTISPSVPELSANELRQNFLIVKPKYVIAGLPYIPAVEEAVKELNPKPKIVEIIDFFKETIGKGYCTDPVSYKPARIQDPKNHVFGCMFSSGTTGTQKAVTLSDYGMLRTNYLTISFIKGFTGPALNASQPNWISWWFSVVRGLINVWTRIFMNNVNTHKILDAVHKFKPAVWHGFTGTVQSMAKAIEEHPGKWDISSLKIVVVGGEILRKEPHENLSKKLNVIIYQSYGSTETGLLATTSPDSPISYGSVGKPVTAIKLVDVTTGKVIIEPNKPGEILVKDTMTLGYVNNPEDTKDAYDENGWFRVGDVGTFNEYGDLFIIDRLKEMFKYCGYQIAPSELETIVNKIPGVNEVAVVGKYVGLEIGYVPTAFVVKSSGSELSEQSILDYLEQENLHDSKKLRGGVIFIDRLPKNASGKVVRAKLRELVNKY